MLDDDFNRQRARLVRELADQADPFIKRRLLDLASRYEHKPLVLPSINVEKHLDHGDDG
ncbi:hypothetical protein PMN64_32295 [Bradyrhizobium sp. UFLA01-814]|uniref:hypothetical protein n=1 Tax=Bradyrhizobium sp. UFLA01-814 TaxID=3023480 RepID=UPI00398AA655